MFPKHHPVPCPIGFDDKEDQNVFVQGKAKKEPAKETPLLASMVAHMVTGAQVTLDIRCVKQPEERRGFRFSRIDLEYYAPGLGVSNILVGTCR